MKKKIRKYLIYILAFCIVLHKRLSLKSRQWMAYAMCVAVLLCSVFSYFYEENIGADQSVIKVEKMSAVTNHGKNASVIITNSQIIESSTNSKDSLDRNGNENRVVANPSAGEKNSAKNNVVEEPEVLSLIEGMYADYGVEIGDIELVQKYQYPVEKGQKTDVNFNRQQKAGDYIMKETYEVNPEEDSVSENDVDTMPEDEGVEVTEEPEEENVAEPIVEESPAVSDNSVSGNTVVKRDVISDEPTERVFDAGCYSFNGTLNTTGTYYVSDILLKPLGVDGYDLVRIGKQGKFYHSVLLTEEGTDISVPLYFSDGKKISNEVVFGYSKDTVNPRLEVVTDGLNVLETEHKQIYCVNEDKIALLLSDEEPGSGIERAKYEFGDRTKYALEDLAHAGIIFGANYYGSVRTHCEDKAGNISKEKEIYCLYENNAPVITTSETARCSAPYSMWIHIAEEGEIVSGIKEITCKVNGEETELSELCVSESVTLYPELTVPTKGWYRILFDEVGKYEIEFTVEDYAGNVTTENRTITVNEPELVSVFMPEHFTIHIDPQQLTEREQVYSDEIKLVNNSEFDVRVNVEEIVLDVNSGVSDMGVEKDCQMYLVAPDTGEKIPLQKGESKDVYSYKLPADSVEGMKNLYFCGDTTEGSDRMWENSDISIQLKLSFEKWEE